MLRIIGGLPNDSGHELSGMETKSTVLSGALRLARALRANPEAQTEIFHLRAGALCTGIQRNSELRFSSDSIPSALASQVVR